MKNTYLIVNKTRNRFNEQVNLAFYVPISVNADTSDKVEYSSLSLKSISLPSVNVRDDQVDYYVRLFSSELHSLLVNFAINDNGEIGLDNIDCLFRDKSGRLIPTSKDDSDTNSMMLALAPSIVSRMNDCHKISNYQQNTDPERVFISFSDNESEQKVIDTIERDMRPFKRVNHDGVAIFKNDILIHSSIKELLLSENSNIESKSFGELRNTIGSLDELAITSKYH